MFLSTNPPSQQSNLSEPQNLMPKQKIRNGLNEETETRKKRNSNSWMETNSTSSSPPKNNFVHTENPPEITDENEKNYVVSPTQFPHSPLDTAHNDMTFGGELYVNGIKFSSMMRHAKSKSHLELSPSSSQIHHPHHSPPSSSSIPPQAIDPAKFLTPPISSSMPFLSLSVPKSDGKAPHEKYRRSAPSLLAIIKNSENIGGANQGFLGSESLDSAKYDDNMPPPSIFVSKEQTIKRKSIPSLNIRSQTNLHNELFSSSPQGAGTPTQSLVPPLPFFQQNSTRQSPSRSPPSSPTVFNSTNKSSRTSPHSNPSTLTPLMASLEGSSLESGQNSPSHSRSPSPVTTVRSPSPTRAVSTMVSSSEKGEISPSKTSKTPALGAILMWKDEETNMWNCHTVTTNNPGQVETTTKSGLKRNFSNSHLIVETTKTHFENNNGNFDEEDQPTTTTNVYSRKNSMDYNQNNTDSSSSENHIQLTIESFNMIKKIGGGGYGVVWLSTKKDTGEIVAIKIMNKEEISQKNRVLNIKNERDVLILSGDQDFSWITALRYAFQDERQLYLAMEFLPGGDLKSLLNNLGTLSEDDLRTWGAEMVLAVDAVHQLGYIHRDLKPANFLIDAQGHLRIADLGISTSGVKTLLDLLHIKVKTKLHNGKMVSSELQFGQPTKNKTTPHRAFSIVGTPTYMAPEIVMQSREKSGYGKEVDWWSLGCMFFEMLTGAPAFYHETAEGVFQSVMNWRERMPRLKEIAAEHISKNAWKLIKGFLSEPSKRLGLNGIIPIQAHPFFQGVDWKNLRSRVPPFVPRLNGPLDCSYFEVHDLDELATQVEDLIDEIEEDDSSFNTSSSTVSSSVDDSTVNLPLNFESEKRHSSFLGGGLANNAQAWPRFDYNRNNEGS